MIVRQWGVIAFILAFVVLGYAANADPVLPVRTGSVVDVAHIIDPSQEQTLVTKAARLKSTSNVELVVVTLPSLRGYSIERWGQALGRGWKVGGSAAHGALLIVAPNEREVRIEVGDGLPFSDSAASSIVDNIIVPKFRSGDMSGGILAGVDAIARAATQLETDSVSYPQPQPTRDVNWYAAGPLLLLVLLGIFVVLRAMSGVLEEEPAHGPSQREARPEPSSVLTKDTSSDGRRSGWFTSDSMWSSSRSSSWLSSRGSSSRSFSSGRSSGGFSGRGASGRW